MCPQRPARLQAKTSGAGTAQKINPRIRFASQRGHVSATITSLDRCAQEIFFLRTTGKFNLEAADCMQSLHGAKLVEEDDTYRGNLSS